MRFFTKMEKFEKEYSMKNIPIPSQRQYKIQLISEVEKLIKRMRWKTLKFLAIMVIIKHLAFNQQNDHHQWIS